MKTDCLLDEPWPPDLDPATVPFLARSVTVLRRAGFFDEPSLLRHVHSGAYVGTFSSIRSLREGAALNVEADRLPL